MRLSFRQIQAFHEVAKTTSFTIAAQQMNLTQSAVSMLVRQMETELGLKLFDRINRSAQLTEVGSQLLPTVARVLNDMQNVVDGAADLKALHRGTLRLAVPQMLACSWLPTVLNDFRSRFPEIELDLTDVTGDTVVTSVANNTAEIGIGPERGAPSGVAMRQLWVEQIQVVIPRNSQLAEKRDGLTWQQLQAEKWIHYSNEFNMHLERTVWLRSVLAKSAHIRVGGLTTALAMVGSGHGLTAAPRYAKMFAEPFNVVFRSIAGENTGRAFCLYHQTGSALSPAASAFVDLVDAHVPGGL
tara:strand:+ start:594 stop:1490 length:897 start_codon:yes stop_codon:yes gene_type:complete